jgi:chemotaxis protein MotB
MAGRKKQPEPEQQLGAPEWMVTFSDCMTLLLTFFVLLLSFSSFDDKDNFRKMNSSFAAQFSFGRQGQSEDDSVSDALRFNQELYYGSEKPTLAEGRKNRFKRKNPPPDYLKYKTFIVSSNDIFWGKGTVISTNGQKILTDLSLFLKELPNYFIIISESGPHDEQDSGQIGLERAWAVFNYLAKEKGVPQQQLNISATGTAVKEYHSNQIRHGGSMINDRMLEIVLLKRSN